MSAHRSVVILVAALALAGCLDDPHAQCGEAITCADLAGEPGWMAGSMEALPDGFPAPPAGAELCGQADGPIVYWRIDDTEDVHEHYRSGLTGSGWSEVGPVQSIESPDAGNVTCGTEQIFTMGDPMIMVHVFPLRHAFSLSLANLEN